MPRSLRVQCPASREALCVNMVVDPRDEDHLLFVWSSDNLPDLEGDERADANGVAPDQHNLSLVPWSRVSEVLCRAPTSVRTRLARDLLNA